MIETFLIPLIATVTAGSGQLIVWYNIFQLSFLEIRKELTND